MAHNSGHAEAAGKARARSRAANHLYYRMTSLLSRLRHHLVRTRLLGEPGIALVAVSGGADSVALLDLLHTLAPELGLSLVVAHVDHGIRSDSGAVARAVRELAERYELPLDRKSTRLNSSHGYISYAVFCLKKKKNNAR